MNKQFNFDNKLAVVTGAAHGIGSAVATLLAQLGATVALIDLDEFALMKTVQKINQDGYRALAYIADISNRLQVQQTLDRIETELGPIELLAHVAGILISTSLLETTLENWENIFKVNTTGSFIVASEISRRLVQRGAGAIVVVTSNASVTPRINLGAYAASKAATSMMVKCLGLELAAKGIRCNLVSPGSTNTSMLKQSLPENADINYVINGNLDLYRVRIPLGKIAEPQDVAQAVAFLLSDLAQHITMADLRVDGGATLGT